VRVEAPALPKWVVRELVSWAFDGGGGAGRTHEVGGDRLARGQQGGACVCVCVWGGGVASSCRDPSTASEAPTARMTWGGDGQEWLGLGERARTGCHACGARGSTFHRFASSCAYASVPRSQAGPHAAGRAHGHRPAHAPANPSPTLRRDGSVRKGGAESSRTVLRPPWAPSLPRSSTLTSVGLPSPAARGWPAAGESWRG
jgi:hypothetical protein